MNRDFKGVWIPKEIWLSKELKMLEKVILTEIYSLDNEDHCIAGNEYFAEFCSCSLSAVSKTIKHLKELGYIEELEFDGRHRKLRVVNFNSLPSKIYYAESQNLLANNIDNKLTNNKNNSKELLQKPKRENLYTKCVNLVDDFVSQHNCGDIVRNKLLSYLKFRLEVKDKPLYTNMWKGMLNKLDSLHKEGYGYEPVIDYCLERGYLSFYPPKNCYNDIKEKPWEKGVKSDTYSVEEKRQLEKDREEMIARGERIWY